MTPMRESDLIMLDYIEKRQGSDILVVTPTIQYSDWILHQLWDKSEKNLGRVGGSRKKDTLIFPDKTEVKCISAHVLSPHSLRGRRWDIILVHESVWWYDNDFWYDQLEDALDPSTENLVLC